MTPTDICDWSCGHEDRCYVQAPRVTVTVTGHGFTYRYCDAHARRVANGLLNSNDLLWKFNGQTVHEFLGAKKKKGWPRDYR